ncbi:DUF2797 domain-containing protein [Candidatus Peregrinibacteria bacterium]|nr:MAG: DUF2797 domain-containing protein [Candidatus Peregrinibacteria bacterium]
MERVYEFRWKKENSPYFRLLQNGLLIEHPLIFGRNVSIEILGNTSCTGYEKNGVWTPCVVGGVPGVKKCEECKKQEGMPIAQYCDGFNTEMFSGEELDSLNCPHYVYFAYFGPGLMKVGVSAQSRGLLRQIEQGSHYSLIIAEELSGVPARQLETLFRKSGMQDKVQSSQKKDLMFPGVSPEEGKQELLEAFQNYLPQVLALRPDFEELLKREPEFHDFSSVYHLPEAEKVEKPFHDADLSLGESVSGTLIAAKGPFLLLETDSEKTLVDAKSLKGYSIDFSAKPLGLKKEQAFQGSLF